MISTDPPIVLRLSKDERRVFQQNQYSGPTVSVALGRDLGADGGGVLCRSDRSPARRLDGSAGQGLVLLNRIAATDLSLLVRPSAGLSGVIPNSSKLKQKDRALTVTTW